MNQNMMESLRKVLYRKLVSFDLSFRGFILRCFVKNRPKEESTEVGTQETTVIVQVRHVET